MQTNDTRRQKYFYVYILSSLSGTLYVGLTDDLPIRIIQHRDGAFDGFTKRHRVNRLLKRALGSQDS